MVAMSAFTIVPDAPLESVIVTFFSLKSIGLSLIILSPASVESESVPSRVMSPSPVSSSKVIRSLIFDWSVSVPSRTNLLPAFSVARCSPAFVPSASVPFNNNLPTVSIS